MTKTAVIFGAGSIGRGFLAPLLQASGFDIVFVEVNDDIVEALSAQRTYRVNEIGESVASRVVGGYRAISSTTAEADVVAAIARAEIVTTAVGACNLQFIGPLIAKGLAARTADTALPVIACETAINATDLLEAEVRRHDSAENAIFANCSVDRIVPQQPVGLDISIESSFEWVVERAPFGRTPPHIVGVSWADDLTPFVDRKLFTLNTARSAAAYLGHDLGWESIREAMAAPDVNAAVMAMLEETTALLVDKHGFSPDDHRAYVEKTIRRISHPRLPDTCDHVGRSPLRKLGRSERFIGAAAQLAERGYTAWSILGAVGVALRFSVPGDTESVKLQALLASGKPSEELVRIITGVDAEHPLFPHLVEVVDNRLSR